MSIFSKIKDAIFGKKAEAAPVPAPEAGTISPAPQPAPVVAEEVDVEAVVSGMPGADNLNWRTSIVDLMKVVGIDASYENRKELAHELGNADYSGSAEDNILLHKQVLKALAENGGKIPAELLD